MTIGGSMSDLPRIQQLEDLQALLCAWASDHHNTARYEMPVREAIRLISNTIEDAREGSR